MRPKRSPRAIRREARRRDSTSLQDTVTREAQASPEKQARILGLQHVQICGGVAANSALRKAMIAEGEEYDFRVYVPPISRCTDNAAMIAAAGYHHLVAGERDGLELDAVPSKPLARAT